MKRIIAAAFALAAMSAGAATLNPVQLLNPKGSTAGQAIVSTGAGTPPAWGNVTATALAPVAANTVIANATGATAAPTAFAMPSCSAANGGLKWTAGSGFTCGTTFALTSGNLSQFAATTSAQLSGVLSDETGSGAAVFGTSPTISSPTISGGTVNNATVGATTPAAGTFTTLAANGNDAMLYQNTSGQSVPDSTLTTITGWTQVFNRTGANFNTSTGVFTAPATGYYHVTAKIVYQAAASAVGSQYILQIFANGVVTQSGMLVAETTGSLIRAVSVSGLVSLAAGQTLSIRAFQNAGGARSLVTTNADYNYITISRVP